MRAKTNSGRKYGFIPPDEPVGIQPMNTNVPAAFNLYQNFPNPFNPATSIKFDIAKKGNVRLVVFDMLGRELSTLIDESLPFTIYFISSVNFIFHLALLFKFNACGGYVIHWLG